MQGAAWLGPALGDLFSFKPNPAVLTLAEGIALGVPLVLLALFWPVVRYRAIFRSWAAAAALVLALALTRLLPSTTGQTITLLQLGIVLVALALLLLFGRNRPLPSAGWTGAAIAPVPCYRLRLSLDRLGRSWFSPWTCSLRLVLALRPVRWRA